MPSLLSLGVFSQLGGLFYSISVTLSLCNDALYSRNRRSAVNASTILRSSGLLIARMNSLKTFETLPKSRRKSFICPGHVAEHGITTCFGNIEGVQESGPRRLVLIRHITMPCDRIGPAGQKVGEGRVVGGSVNKVDFGKSFWGATTIIVNRRAYTPSPEFTWSGGCAIFQNIVQTPGLSR